MSKTRTEYTGGLEAFITGYIACALWSEMDNSDENTGGEPLDANYDTSDIAPETMASIRQECEAFYNENLELFKDQWDASQAGHDFWLTRNHHGAGYWDRGRANGDKLTEAANAAGSRDLYVGDDGRIYQ